MVTSRQVTRGVFRTMRAMDRAAKQSERRRVAHNNALQRQAHLDTSANAAVAYETMIEALTGAHRITFSRKDWLTTATRDPVPEPKRHDVAERAAEAAVADFKPGWATRILRREIKVRQSLVDAVPRARQLDDNLYATSIAAAATENESILAAQQVIERRPDALVQALELHSELGNLPFSVEAVDTTFLDKRVIAIVDGLDLEDMPEESITLLKSGKASVKSLGVGKRHELHRDTICSAAVRVALEFLATLPIDEVEVLMLTDILDRGSGHIAPEPVLHLRLTVQAALALNLSHTEAFALVNRLGGHFEWNKRDGFRAINASAFGIEFKW
jgi:hypothetical protein